MKPKKIEESDYIGIVLPASKAKLCVEETCDVIFVGDKCPRCESKNGIYLSKIIKTK